MSRPRRRGALGRSLPRTSGVNTGGCAGEILDPHGRGPGVSRVGGEGEPPGRHRPRVSDPRRPPRPQICGVRAGGASSRRPTVGPGVTDTGGDRGLNVGGASARRPAGGPGSTPEGSAGSATAAPPPGTPPEGPRSPTPGGGGLRTQCRRGSPRRPIGGPGVFSTGDAGVSAPRPVVRLLLQPALRCSPTGRSTRARTAGVGGVSSNIPSRGARWSDVSNAADSGACRTPSLPSPRTHSPHTRLQSSSPGVTSAAASSSGTRCRGIHLAQEEQRTGPGLLSTSPASSSSRAR